MTDPLDRLTIPGVIRAIDEQSGGLVASEDFIPLPCSHPLLPFRCLPNMPAFHVSLNFAIRGPYFVTYPGLGQFYLALERAVAA